MAGESADIVVSSLSRSLYNTANGSLGGFTYQPYLSGSERSDIILLPPAQGTQFLATFDLLHELGHSIGLLDADAILPSDQRNTRYSVMSYAVALIGERRLPTELKLYNIAAIQALYGRNATSGAGNSTYSDFTAHAPDTISADRMVSIYDASGVDTITASTYDAAYIDLRPGYFSSIGPRNSVAVTGGGSPSIGSLGWLNVPIAFGSYIENATGGSSNDLLIGNVLSNTLKGGAGDDIIYAEGAAVDISAVGLDADAGDYRRR